MPLNPNIIQFKDAQTDASIYPVGLMEAIFDSSSEAQMQSFIEEYNISNHHFNTTSSASGSNRAGTKKFTFAEAKEILLSNGPAGAKHSGIKITFLDENNNWVTYENVFNGNGFDPADTNWKKVEVPEKVALLDCSTAASTATKVVTYPGYALLDIGVLKVKFTNANTNASPKLNINSTGAKTIVYNGSVANATNSWAAGEVVDFYYDPSYNSNAGAYIGCSTQVTITQNASTGHTEINIGGVANPVASVEEVNQLGQKLGLFQSNSGAVGQNAGPGFTNHYVTNEYVTLLQGHKYRITLNLPTSISFNSSASFKLMTPDSLSNVYTLVAIAGETLNSGDNVFELEWTSASVKYYRAGFYAQENITGITTEIRDITLDKINTDVAPIVKCPSTRYAIVNCCTPSEGVINITASTIVLPKGTRVMYGVGQYTALTTNAVTLTRSGNYQDLVCWNKTSNTFVIRAINAVSDDDYILFSVQKTDTGSRCSLSPDLYTIDGKPKYTAYRAVDATPTSGSTKFVESGGVKQYVDNSVINISNTSYPTKSGKLESITASTHTYIITDVELVNGHKYKATIAPDSPFSAPSDFNLKVVSDDSDVTILRIASLGGLTVDTESFEFLWEENTGETYRVGFYGNGNVATPIKVTIQDITVDSVSEDDFLKRNRYKEPALVSVASYRGNDAFKVANKLTLIHFSDVHGNTANIGDVVKYWEHYSSMLDDCIHTGDSVQTTINNPNPFESVDGAESILNVIGNHEAWLNNTDPDYYATEKQTYDKIFAPSIANWNVVQPTDAATNGYCYYYKDFTTAGFRLIVLDSVHWHYRNGVTDSNPAQKSWFESVLADAKTNGLRVVCAMHYPPQNGIVPAANDTGWNAPVLPSAGGLIGDGWYAADEIFDCVDDFIDAGGKFHGWIIGHTHEDFFGSVLGHTSQPIVVIGTANGVGYLYDKFITGTVAQDNFNIITFETLYSKNYIKIVKIGGDCDVLMRSKKTICYNITDGILIANT